MPRIRIILAFLMLIAGVSLTPAFKSAERGVALTVGISTADAQEVKKKRRGLFRMLFGRKKAKKAVVTKRKKRVRRAKKRNRSKRRVARSSTATAAKAAVEKSDDAKKVLVVGDFFAGGLADGLADAMADQANIVVVDRSKALSGFVRDDIVDWSQTLPKLIEEEKPSYIIAMVGANDRQMIKGGGKRLKRRTPEWDEEYKARTTALGEALKTSGIRYSWVGLPPVRFKGMSKDYLFFNENYAAAAASETGQFIDVWDGFSDADGNYSRSGPDIQGQITLLRRKDGINLTKAGRRRLAFYVESIVTNTLGGDTAVAGVTGLDSGAVLPKSEEYDPQKTRRTIVVRLNDPSADGAAELAGDVSTKKQPAAVPREPIISRPVASPTRRVGRVDDYAWPPVQDAVAPAAPSVVSANSN
ncbi:MAG: SGNH family hydrolase [Pseudomonadota bacterium]